MVFNFNEFESRIIKSLGDSGLIDNFSVDEISKNPDISFIIEIFKYPSKLDFDDDGLFFLNGDGDKIYCPEIRTSISDKGEWLSDKLPPCGIWHRSEWKC